MASTDDAVIDKTHQAAKQAGEAEKETAAPNGREWPRGRWLGLAAVLIVLVVSLVIWGSNMGFPTTVAHEQSSDGSVMLPVSAREVVADVIDGGVSWLTREAAWAFDGLGTGVTYALVYIERGLKWTPWPAVVVALGLMAYAVGRVPLLAFALSALFFIGFMDLWNRTMETLALMVVAVAVCIAIGLPIGIIGARSDFVDRLMRPILDGMQTMPSFVYLLPGILFFGLGKPGAIFATLLYAMPPVIRLTNLGIRQVAPDVVDAARAFGSSHWQILTKVQVPMALPTIMAGVNQTTMMALAMVVIASLVGAGGLGDNVNRALQKNEPGNGLLAGLAIVFLAIIIDRLTQAVAARRTEAVTAG